MARVALHTKRNVAVGCTSKGNSSAIPRPSCRPLPRAGRVREIHLYSCTHQAAASIELFIFLPAQTRLKQFHCLPVQVELATDGVMCWRDRATHSAVTPGALAHRAGELAALGCARFPRCNPITHGQVGLRPCPCVVYWFCVTPMSARLLPRARVDTCGCSVGASGLYIYGRPARGKEKGRRGKLITFESSRSLIVCKGSFIGSLFALLESVLHGAAPRVPVVSCFLPSQLKPDVRDSFAIAMRSSCSGEKWRRLGLTLFPNWLCNKTRIIELTLRKADLHLAQRK